MKSGRGNYLYGRFNADFSDGRWLETELGNNGYGAEATRAAQIISLGPKKLGKMNTDRHLEELIELGSHVGCLFNTTHISTHFPPS